MSENSRNNIFKRIQNSLKLSSPKPYPELGETFVFEKNNIDLTTLLLDRFSALGVHCSFFNSEIELKNYLEEIIQSRNINSLIFESTELQDALGVSVSNYENLTQGNSAAVTSCHGLIAKTGTVLVSSSQGGGRKQNIAPDIHIVVASKNQIVYNINDALNTFDPDNLPSLLCFISGASRTADIEKTLVMGAHGPKALYVFIRN